MALSGIDIGSFKILRTLRILKPLRFITHNQNMKIVVNALLGSVSAIFNVAIVMLAVWIMFGILGISFMKHEMGYCSGIGRYYGVGKEACELMGGHWKIWPWNFDNIGNAFTTLFVLSSLEGWPDIMATSFDAGPEDTGPIYNNNIIFGFLFFLSFIMIGS
jgi:hypothetical protein